MEAMDIGYGDKKMAGSGQTHRLGLSCGHTNPPDGSTSFPLLKEPFFMIIR